jgi:hypothetical protein
MPICKALLKHGYSNFSLEILEYCDSFKNIEREQYYIEKLKPEYNIQLFPSTPRLGLKHSKEAIAKLRESLKGLPKTDQHKLNLSLADPSSTPIVVTDLLDNKAVVYPSMRAAAKELEISPSSISN